MKTKILSVFVSAVLVFAPFSASGGSSAFPMKYEGGSLPLNQHSGVKVSVTSDAIVCVQGKTRHGIPSAG
jgi:hypothetical protein